MPTQSILIIGPESASRTQIEDILKSSGWICVVADSVTDVQSIQGGQDLRIAFVPITELLKPDFVFWSEATQPNLQLIAYAVSKHEQIDVSSANSKLFAILNDPDLFPVQIALTASRAGAYADSISGTSNLSIDSVYRKLFEASATLQTSETLTQLLERTCREISHGAGFGRAVLVLSDQKFRIQTAQAYFADEQNAIEILSLVGQPLLPVLPNAPFEQLVWGE